MSDPDGDGIYSITLDLPIGDFEYKYALDSWTYQEDLVDDMQAGGTCAPVTDYSSFANRLVNVLPGTITNDSYGTCVECILGCTDSLACNFDALATFDDGSCLNGPDLQVSVNTILNSLQINSFTSSDECLVAEGCITGTGERKTLRFTTTISNYGNEDFYIGQSGGADNLNTNF